MALLGADSSYYTKTTTATVHHTSSAATVIFVLLFVVAGGVGVLALRTVLRSRRPDTRAHDNALLQALEPPPELQEVWMRPSDTPQPLAWDTFMPISATRIPTDATETRPPTNHSQGPDVFRTPPAKYCLVQVAVLLSMPSERHGGIPLAAHPKALPEVNAGDDTMSRKGPDVAFGIATMRCALDDSDP